MTDTQPRAVPPSQPVMVLGGRIDPAEIGGLCERALALLEVSGRFTLRCQVESLEADAVALDALAQLALVCRRLGRRLELRGASPRLEELVAFAGLIEVLPCLPEEGSARSGLEVRRQTEQRKEPGRVEEERDPCDPIS